MTADTSPRHNATLKLTIEMGPLIVFFGTYFLAPRFGVADPIFPATGLFMIATTAAMIASWRIEGKIAPMLWVSSGVVIVMGGLTLILHDDTFIKMKPTIVNSIFALTIIGSLMVDRPVLKPLFQSAFPPITHRGWRELSRNWAAFFLFLALLNETIWRNFSEEFWVAFKVWGNIPLTFAMALYQVRVMNRNLDRAEDDAPGGD
ncbi:intracellular septation protein [Rhodothalassium salexigens DSM 2132]|uniref:Inner membrane-spanning protein YciB n=1 Tax=Rhodothalassium salexigens DSM 2132 TaxID=1188247 RepID=A0A4R2PBL5_RHOSA|nr:septation protein A [Rhodothalassium salexigens]MBB4212339.1 intracellular septation protein [Rhodothalassium salexigens DSM 2132]MBK1638839.1 hypothetical protein [Rhodothalassium salexigens DSM 2132]MBK5921732.1 hypothetical protein [Rhodothalassium salexigens]TCP32510.1 intracellular septation protein [Rhodothalassium salexigens DSM 2132]